MRIVRSLPDLEPALASLKKIGKVGFVPTMGALHEGHLSLIRMAKRENRSVIVSIFVNPLQFGPSEDYARYPRALRRDCALARSAGADLIFAPEAAELLKSPLNRPAYVPKLAAALCGPFRPGHFAGVSRIVALFFSLLRPDSAYFGLKDFQQCRVIEEMAAKEFPRIRIRLVPTKRENDGLAMSSRNRYLSRAERREALKLYRALRTAGARLRAGGSPASAESAMRRLVDTIPGVRVDYLSVVDARNLRKVVKSSPKPSCGFLAAGAIRIGKTRLIDNVWIK